MSSSVQHVGTISLRRVAALNYLRHVCRVLTLLALAASAAAVLYVVAYGFYEWYWPPVVRHTGLFGDGPDYRTPFLIAPALRWIARFMFVTATAQMIVSSAFIWHGRPASKRVVVTLLFYSLWMFFRLASGLSCGC